MALWLCGDPTEASDLTQDTYERAFRARASLTRTNMRAWLFTILRHRFLNVRRHREVAGEVPLEEPDLVALPSILDLPPGWSDETSRRRRSSCRRPSKLCVENLSPSFRQKRRPGIASKGLGFYPWEVEQCDRGKSR
ncbi:MAG: hypothetical protein HYR50_08520 [Candidatus Rokubacteria bacterium]|nr:hypothetical protein [Candidatus Rokubacteria bacterium]